MHHAILLNTLLNLEDPALICFKVDRISCFWFHLLLCSFCTFCVAEALESVITLQFDPLTYLRITLGVIPYNTL